MSIIDRLRLTGSSTGSGISFDTLHPASKALFQDATHLFGRVPMTWMAMWSGGFPLYLDRAAGNRVVDVDGHEYVDFALGDTGAMAGHSPQPTLDAVIDRISTRGGITTMLPTADAEWVGAELTRRFGLPLWSFTLTATDANRWAIRLARLATRRPKILTFAYCYHGSVDEAFALPGPTGRPWRDLATSASPCRSTTPPGSRSSTTSPTWKHSWRTVTSPRSSPNPHSPTSASSSQSLASWPACASLPRRTAPC